MKIEQVDQYYYKFFNQNTGKIFNEILAVITKITDSINAINDASNILEIYNNDEIKDKHNILKE